jgi:hypothetical protein
VGPAASLNNFKIFQIRSNMVQCKTSLPELKKFERKYDFEGFDIRNIFTYWKFFRFGKGFELIFREPCMSGFQLKFD